MNQFPRTAALFAVLVLTGLGCTSSGPNPDSGALPPDAWCYELTQDPSVRIVIRPDFMPTITTDNQTVLHDAITIVEAGFDSETTIGRIDNDQFFYADGSGFLFRADTIEGFGKGLEEFVGTAVDCATIPLND